MTSTDWERKFAEWAQPPSRAKFDDRARVSEEVQRALASSSKLGKRKVQFFVYGSYATGVHVVAERPVDVGVVCLGMKFDKLGIDPRTVDLDGSRPNSVFEQFKDELGEALTNHFGSASVARTPAAFSVVRESVGLRAEVTPFFIHRTFDDCFEARTDDKHFLKRWPASHAKLSLHEDEMTKGSFKGVVRILKALQREMEATGKATWAPMTGFFVESIVQNAKRETFTGDDWVSRVRSVVGHLSSRVRYDGDDGSWHYMRMSDALFTPHLFVTPDGSGAGTSSDVRRRVEKFTETCRTLLGA